jgi:hypothetical protein
MRTPLLWSMFAVCASLALSSCARSGGDASTPILDASVPEATPPVPVFSGESGASTCTCSRDLHTVIGCGAPVQCGDAEGCAAGRCVPACEAAAAEQSSVGCDYFSFNPDVLSEQVGDCFAAFIANTWGSDVTLSVTYDGQALTNLSDFARISTGTGKQLGYQALQGSGNVLPAGQVAILFLASQPGAHAECPAGVKPAVPIDAAMHGTGKTKAFHIAADRPVTAYDIYPYGGGATAVTAATLLLPTSAWGTNYMAVDGYVPYSGNPWIAIVGSKDGTTVTLNPTTDIPAGGGLAAATKGTPTTYAVNQGEVIQLFGQDRNVSGHGTELVGTPIQSDQPVAVFGGSTGINVPTNYQAADAAHQQIPPVKALGHEYVYARYRDRYPGTPEQPPVRIVGVVGGTTLSYLPAQPDGAPATLGSGEMVEFNASSAFIVRSQDDAHPFYLAAYMTGCTGYAPMGAFTNDCRGDPEFVSVVTPDEYLPSYTFFTDPTYPETELVVVRKKGPAGFADVTLDCIGPIGNWYDVGDGSEYQFARAPLSTGNFQAVGSCDNGRHEMSSTAPFGLTVWGWGSAVTGGSYADPYTSGFYSQCVSYAYPAGMSVLPVTNVVVPVATQ